MTRRTLPGGFRAFQVFDVFEDRDDRIWLGLFAGEMAVSKGAVSEAHQASDWRLYTAEAGLAPGKEPRIAQARDGVIWAVSNSTAHDINRFDSSGWSQVKPVYENWSAVNTSVLETRDGTLWIGGFLLAALCLK